MSELICPECHANLQDDLVESTGRAECPFCSADLSALDWSRPLNATPSAPPETSGERTVAPAEPVALPPLPAKSRIDVIEATPHRKLFYIPAGGKRTTSLGWFVLLWNSIMLPITAAVLHEHFIAGKAQESAYIMFPFLGVFLLVGFGMGYWWLRMRFERTILLLEKGRLVVQRILFGRKRLEEARLNDESRAELAEAYTENERPVYSVAVRGIDRTVKFGTPLSDEEKDWLVRQINEHLGQGASTSSPDADFALNCRQCGALLTATGATTPHAPLKCPECGATIQPVVQPLAEGERFTHPEACSVLEDAGYRLDESKPGFLRINYPVANLGPVRWMVAIFCGLFSFVWIGICVGTILGSQWTDAGGAERWIPVAIASVFLLPGMIPVLMTLVAIAGTYTVEMGPETLALRLGVGGWAWSRVIPLATIQRVDVVKGSPVQNRNPQPGRQYYTCTTWTSGPFLPLAMSTDIRVPQAMRSLLIQHLHAAGHRLENE